MKKRDKIDSWAYASVQGLVEDQVTGRHHNLTVAGLRMLLRVAALSESGALVRGTDIAATGITADSYTRNQLQDLRKHNWISIRGGWVGSGYYVITSAGKAVCEEFSAAQIRAAKNLLAFEPVKPFNRLTPLKHLHKLSIIILLIYAYLYKLS